MNNPFIISGSIPPKYFCDRRGESTKIVRTLTNEGNLCIISPRRMGKSQLIHFCYEKPELADGYYLFFIDILHTSGIREFTYTFGQKVFNVLHSKSRKMFDAFVQGLKSVNGKFGFDPVSGTPTFSLELGDISHPEFTLEEIFDCLERADKPCIVAFDEFQQICRFPEKNIEALLRSHIQQLRNVHFVFSGSERHLITAMFLSSARPFYNSVSIMELPPIALAEYIPFVCRCFEETKRSIQPDDVQKVYDLLEGNTYYMQRTFHEAVLNTPEGGKCTTDILHSTIQTLLDEEGDAYRLVLSRIPERQKELLYAVALEGQARQIMSAKFINKYALASASAVQAAVRKLMEADLITITDGCYYVPDILFRLYLQQLKNPNATFL